MNSIVLQTASRFMLPLLALFSIFLFEGGHNEPGGGFVGGLMLAASIALYAIAFGVEPARRVLRIEPRTLIGLGLLVALGTGFIGTLAGEPYLTGQWIDLHGPHERTVHLGSPLLFDLGVYLVVTGVALTVILALLKESASGS